MSVGAKTAIIDYGMGNLRSVYRAWEAVGAKARIISSPSEIEGDDLLIFPGQGAVADTMKLLKSTGFDSAIRDWQTSRSLGYASACRRFSSFPRRAAARNAWAYLREA